MNTTHEMTIIRSPINHLIKCSCGWSRTIPRQNALARAAKVKAAIRQHEKETAAKSFIRSLRHSELG